jgi:hypothetical protein
MKSFIIKEFFINFKKKKTQEKFWICFFKKNNLFQNFKEKAYAKVYGSYECLGRIDIKLFKNI